MIILWYLHMKGVTTTEFKNFFAAHSFDLFVLKRNQKYHFKLTNKITSAEFFIANARIRKESLRFKSLDTVQRTASDLGFKTFVFQDQDAGK